jgi:hypothetical protein
MMNNPASDLIGKTRSWQKGTPKCVWMAAFWRKCDRRRPEDMQFEDFGD